MHEFYVNTNKLCMNLHEHAWKLIKISGFAVDIWSIWPKYVKFIYKYHHYIHCNIYLYAPAPSLKKCNFCYEQIYLSLAGKGLSSIEIVLFQHILVRRIHRFSLSPVWLSKFQLNSPAIHAIHRNLFLKVNWMSGHPAMNHFPTYLQLNVAFVKPLKIRFRLN